MIDLKGSPESYIRARQAQQIGVRGAVLDRAPSAVTACHAASRPDLETLVVNTYKRFSGSRISPSACDVVSRLSSSRFFVF